MKCKKFFAAAAACLMVAGFAACGNEPTPVNPDEKVFQIGICQLVEHPALDEATRGLPQHLLPNPESRGRAYRLQQQLYHL